jgi:hypothetical protein
MNESSERTNGQANGYGLGERGQQFDGSDQQAQQAYVADTSEVLKKANDIKDALDHSELTIAHFIAAITSSPTAANRFNKLRLNGGSETLNSVQARQACFNYLLAKLDDKAEESLGHSALREVFSRAEKLASERAYEHQRVELGDVLKVMTETELADKFRPLLLGEPMPSLGKLSEAVVRVEDSIRQLSRDELGALKFLIEKTHRAVESHARDFKEVASAEEENRPGQISRLDSSFPSESARPNAESSVLKLKDIVTSVEKNRSATDLRLATVASVVDKLGTLTVSNSEKLGTVDAKVASLQEVCSKTLARLRTLAITAGLALAALVVFCALLGYKAYPLWGTHG